MNEPRYCKHCAEPLSVGDRYCSACGTESVWMVASWPLPSGRAPVTEEYPTTGTPVTQEFLAQQAKAQQMEKDKSAVIGCGAMMLAIGFFLFLYLIGYR